MNSITPFWLIVSLIFFSLVPILIGVCTSYLKINIVVGMLRNGLGTQHAPSNLVIMVLSLSLSIFIMAPVVERSLELSDGLFNNVSDKNFSKGFDLKNLKPVLKPWQDFMQQQSGSYEIEVLQELAKQHHLSNVLDEENSKNEIPLYILVPAFLLSELKEAFSMGFIILLPFLVIDLIIANILAGMGMYMLSPTIISLPIKLLFFVMSDGWLLLSQSLISSYH